MTQPGTYGDDTPSMLETKQDIERARERLRRRDPESLVEFLISLAGDSGPVGEQIRTFVVTCLETVLSDTLPPGAGTAP